MERGNKKKIIIIVGLVILLVGLDLIMGKILRKDDPKKELPPVEIDAGFNINIIKTTYALSNNSNYLISPYNIEVALNMLREGAMDNTKDEIDKVIGNRKINDVSIKDKVNVANGVFIKNKYQNDIKTSFTNDLKTKYNAEIIYDEYDTPNVINDWVKKNTNEMIDKILDDMSPDFVLGLASALAIDVKWNIPFKCYDTISEKFTKVDNTEMNVEMMHNTYTYGVKYFKNDEALGIILPYQKEENSDNQLEFIGILPSNGVNEYISSLSNEKINSLFDNTIASSDKLHINLSLPRFTYDYEVSELSNVLKNMGINDAFDEDLANFKKMIDIKDNVYVTTAIHKTKIELSEEGTKAAAVTYFGVEASGMIPQEYDSVDIKFNKPFVYMIREKNTGEILFFGIVFEPNKWEGSTCKGE